MRERLVVMVNNLNYKKPVGALYIFKHVLENNFVFFI